MCQFIYIQNCIKYYRTHALQIHFITYSLWDYGTSLSILPVKSTHYGLAHKFWNIYWIWLESPIKFTLFCVTNAENWFYFNLRESVLESLSKFINKISNFCKLRIRWNFKLFLKHFAKFCFQRFQFILFSARKSVI